MFSSKDRLTFLILTNSLLHAPQSIAFKSINFSLVTGERFQVSLLAIGSLQKSVVKANELLSGVP